MSNKKWADFEIIRAIKGTDTDRGKVWEYIFNQTDWRIFVLKHVLKNNGDTNDAVQLFQDTCLKFDEKILANAYEGRSNLKSFFMGIMKIKWLKELEQRRKRGTRFTDLDAVSNLNHPDSNFEEHYISEEKKEFLWKMIDQLGDRCKKIYKLAANGFTGEEIALEVGLAGGASATKREKNRCRLQLLQKIKDNPNWKDYIK